VDLDVLRIARGDILGVTGFDSLEQAPHKVALP
jgi:hypothetical protein